jgi:hypothetical protein
MIETGHPITESTGWPTVHTSVPVCLWSVFGAEAARLRHDGRVESGAIPHGQDNVTLEILDLFASTHIVRLAALRKKQIGQQVLMASRKRDVGV